MTQKQDLAGDGSGANKNPEHAKTEQVDSVHRCGFVAILGRPNAGKSTLLNRLAGEKVAIVSPRPQTTRDRVNGIRTEPDAQFIFVDTPGLVEPRDRLHLALLESIRQALDGVDAVVHLIDAADDEPLAAPAGEVIAAVNAPLIAAINKIDGPRRSFNLARQLKRRPGWINRERYVEIVRLSAMTGAGVDRLLGVLRPLLPEGPPHYDPESPTDRDMRWLAGETVREKAFLLLGEEVPYSIAAETEEFSEREDGKWFIRVVLYVERESQKGILIGAGGTMLKRIGQSARTEIEKMTDHPVYLELWVKVRHNWTKKEDDLRRFGYASAPENTPKSRRSKR